MSEFGKGLVTCLAKFYQHFSDRYRTCLDKKHPSDDDAWMFMNGASDHLYEVVVPEGKQWDSIRDRVEKIQGRALKMGHGFDRNRGTWKDVDEMEHETLSLLVEVDKIIGIADADKGEW